MPRWRVDDDVFESADLELAIESADLVILLQHHREYDLEWLERKAPLLFDTRGVSSSDDVHRL